VKGGRAFKFAISLGPLPHEAINRTLELDLTFGEVILSRAAQVHAERRHPDDYGRLLPFLGSVIANPLYVGDDIKNAGKIELVGRASAAVNFMLIAVSITQDEAGQYHIASFYPVSREKIDARRQKGFLQVLKYKRGPEPP
jgi:hypothetical protein